MRAPARSHWFAMRSATACNSRLFPAAVCVRHPAAAFAAWTRSVVHGEDGQGESPGCPNQTPGPDVCQVGPRKGSVRPSRIGSDQEEISGWLAVYSAHQP